MVSVSATSGKPVTESETYCLWLYKRCTDAYIVVLQISTIHPPGQDCTTMASYGHLYS